MRVLAITKVFPNGLEPASSPFNRLQFGALAKSCELEILATIPWFPGASLLGRWSASGRLTQVPAFERIDDLDVQHPRVLYLPKWGHALSGQLYAASLAATVLKRRGSVDVVLGSWAYPDGHAAVQLAELLGVPAVIKVHGSDLNVLGQRKALRRRITWALSRADRVVAVSRPLAELAIELGASRERVDVIPNGVERAAFQPRDRGEARRALGLAEEGPIVLYVGRVTEQKGALDLVRAFGAAGSALRGTRLLIVGEGAGSAEAAALVRSLGVEATLVGSEPHARVPLWLAACDVLALPSWNEGTPNVVLEALAAGRRVVATSVGGIPDVVTSDSLGLLVPPRNPGALAAALIAATSTPYDPVAVARLAPSPSWDESAHMLRASLLLALEARASAAVEPRPFVRKPSPSLTPTPTPSRSPSPTPSLVARGRRGARAVAEIFAPPSVVVWRGPPAREHTLGRRGRIALTFDDGPTSLTRDYLAVLARFGVRATFFLVGELCARHPELVQAIANDGHEIAGHGYTHRRFPSLTRRALTVELEETRRLLPSDERPRPFVRPPHGAISVASTFTTVAAGYTTVLWSYDSGDWATKDPRAVAERFTEKPVAGGDIVLMHEGQTWTLDALPRVLETLRGADHELVTTGELLLG